MAEAAIQEFTPEQKKLFNQKLKKLEEEIEKYQEATHIEFEGRKIRKTLTQRIPWTKEEWEKYQRDKKAHDNKKLNSFIDKVFFEDGALQMPPPKPKEKKGIINLKEIKNNRTKQRAK